MSFAILGMGTAVPSPRYSQEETAAVAAHVSARTEKEAAALRALFRQTRIAHRHLVHGRRYFEELAHGELSMMPRDGSEGPGTAERMEEYTHASLSLAVEASRGALERSGTPAKSISHLITVSCTGFAAPGVDIGLMRELGLAPTVERTHVGFMGCHGALNGLRVARALVEANPAARVLLCAVELCSLHYHYPFDPNRITGNALFADGAAALVGGSGTGWRVTANGACLFPGSEDAMTWTIGDHGFDMRLSTRVPGLIAMHLRPWITEWLAQRRLTIGQVGSWAVHPGGPRILASVEETLGLAPKTCGVSFEVLTQFGNMSSPTVLFILDELRRRNAPRPCVALGFGPGLAAEAALLE
jgi:predicted naringenin-chalcone synthase